MVTNQNIVESLISVGYSLEEISKYSGVTIDVLEMMKRNEEINEDDENKINNFLRLNLEEVELKKFRTKKYRNSHLVLTPDGFQKCSAWVKKGPLHCFKITINNCFDTITADKHAFQMPDGEWITTDLLKIGDKLQVLDGEGEVTAIEDAGEIECFDITIDHPNHRYYLDGISSHNTGKSLLAGLIISNALKQGFDHIFYFDSEGGGSSEFFENIGCDSSKIQQILVSSVEDAQIKILEVYNGIRELKKSLSEDEEQPKFLCVLDSLGALVIDKLLTDAEKGKVVSDMGSKSKKLNSMIKAITIPALETDTAMICINHVYDDPAAMFAGKIKNQGGGKGLQYMGSINVQCTKLLEKDEDKDSEQFYSGTHLRFFTIKNRFARPGLECDVYLDFKKGFVRPFESLWDEAIRGGFILNPKQGYYTVPSWKEPDKMFRQSQICNNAEIWKSFLNQFQLWSISDLKYHKINTDEENLNSESVQDIDEPIEEENTEETSKKDKKK